MIFKKIIINGVSYGDNNLFLADPVTHVDFKD